MKIKIVLDLTKKISTKNNPVFHDEKDYFNAYVLLKKAVKQNINKTVIIYDKFLAKWLLKGFKKYTDAEIELIEYNYIKLLAEQWNITYDIQITENQIEKGNLLDLQVDEDDEQPLSNFIANNFISTHLNNDKVSKFKFGKLINDLILFEKNKNKYPKLFQTVLQIKINNWLKNDSKNKNLINPLTNDIMSFYKTLSKYKLVKNYPEEFQKKCLDNKWIKLLKRTKPSLKDLNVECFLQDESFKNIKDEFNIFFEKFKKFDTFNKGEVKKLLGYFSGELNIEAEFILRILKNNPVLISDSLISKLKKTFKPILDLYGQIINTLKNYKKPKYPKPFKPDWDLKQALNWAKNEYLPYRFWLESVRKYDEKITKFSCQFTDYIFERYKEYIYQHKNVIYRFIFNNKDLIKNTNIPILVILDNFNYKHINKLKNALVKYDILLKQSNPYLSLLPTETSIGKKSIFGGTVETSKIKETSYKEILTTIWKNNFAEHKIKYISKIGRLNRYNPNEKEFIVINYTSIDSELHKSYEKTSIEHNKIISFLIVEFAKALANFLKKNNIQTKSKIFFISDHGSTLINSEMPNEIDVQLFNKYNIDLSHRFIPLNNKKFDNLKNNANISDALYFLDKNFTGYKKNYIIARGYNRFKDINESFYVHGGATPEEIIIPGGYFEYNTKSEKNLIVQLTKKEYRLKTRDTIKLRIANPNEFKIENVLINIYANDIQLSEISVNKLNSKDDKNVESEIRIPNRNIDEFLVKLNYEITGNYKELEQKFPIKIKTMTSPMIDLNDL